MKILLLCVLLSNLILAQETALTTDYKKLKLPEERIFNHPDFTHNENSDYYYIEAYDRFTDNTTIRMGIKINSELKLELANIYYGKDRSVPNNIVFFFVSKSKKEIYKNEQQLYFLVDDKRMELGELFYRKNIEGKTIIEKLDIVISINNFIRIINGTNAEFKIWEKEFTLNEQNLEALRDFASRLDD